MNDFLTLLTPYVSLSPEDAAACAPYVSKQCFEKNEFISRAGDVCEDLFFVTDGLVRCFYIYEDREINLRLLCEPSAVLALSSFITHAPAEEYVQCIAPSRGYRVRLRAFLEEVPGAAAEHIARVVAEQHYLAMERRLKTLQRKSASERYEYFRVHMEPRIVRETPGYHVASYLGITPESFSRLKSTS